MAGSVKLANSEELEGHYGLAPHLRFLESSWPGATDQQLNDALRGAPSGMTPEEKIRYLERRLPRSGVPLLQEIILGIHRKFVEEGPFDCILGYSEGAAIAATFVVDSLTKFAAGDNIGTPRCAVFLNGCPPMSMDQKNDSLLADKDGQVITIPTCHILAHNDVMAYASTALYHLCDEELAMVLDHGRGHSLPRDIKTCKLVTAAIRDPVDRTENAANVEKSCTEESQ